MAKLTRKSYKRKKIAFAAVILGGVALVSSGFAAWVLSAQANGNADGNVKVGTVENGALKMKIYKDSSYTSEIDNVNVKADDFSFNALESDTKKDGVPNRVYWKQKEGEEPERLSLTFYVEIKSKTDSFSSLNVKFNANDKTSDQIQTNYKEAVTSEYITMPTAATDNGTTITLDADRNTFKGLDVGSNDSIKGPKPGKEGDEYVYKIAYTVSFKWGARYNQKNPCLFFDGAEANNATNDANKFNGKKGNEVDIDDVDADLTKLHQFLDGVTYTVTFTATGV